jgi:hypothetical protein
MKGDAMKKLVIGALVTTAMVLVTVFVLNKIPYTAGFVQKALNG